jgi:PPOX class probable F420-dependent enzyme
VKLPGDLLALLSQPSLCYLSTLMPDGSPQLTQTWVDTDGEHVLVNSVAGFQKIRNIERDPRVALTVTDPERTARYFAAWADLIPGTEAATSSGCWSPSKRARSAASDRRPPPSARG